MNIITNSMYVVTLKLPDGINYYCGLVMHPTLKILCHEWDTDINYAKKYNTKVEAQKQRSLLITLQGSTRAKVKPYIVRTIN